MKKPTSFTCAQCGASCCRVVYAPAPPYFCNRKCWGRYQWRDSRTSVTCSHCGREFDLINSRIKKNPAHFCSQECKSLWQSERVSGHNNPSYRNGRWICRGYVFISRDGRPYPEHRHLMEQHLGRQLGRDEHVHHINHIKHDNRIENLEVIHCTRHKVEKHPLLTWGKRGVTECCVCHTAEHPHKSRGVCARCYEKSRTGRVWTKKRTLSPEEIAQFWKTRMPPYCTVCGSTERRHAARGICARCYNRQWLRDNR